MHALATQLPVIVAAEKSRTAFYIVGSALVAWAFIVSCLFGLRQVDFPGSQSLERVVIAISAGLVIATAATGVITAGTPSKTAEAATPPGVVPANVHTLLKLEASKTGLAYNTRQLTAKAGTVTITFTNESQIEHNVTVSKPGLRVAKSGEVLGATPTFKGGSRTLTLKLAAGKYTYFCSVPGHREAGMEGTLTVQ
jgi:plastocyanin